MAKGDAPELVSMAAFAKALGCKRQYVTQLRKDGRLVMKGKRVDLQASLARVSETRDPSKSQVVARHAAARSDSPALGVGDSGVSHNRFAASVPSTDEDRLAGGYQRARAVRDAVDSAVRGAAAKLREALERLPYSVGAQLAIENDESRCIALLADEVEHALGEVARSFSDLVRKRES